MSRPIIVVGIARSGTSFTASVLDSIGVTTVIDSFLPPDEFNPGGYWEDKRVKSLSHLMEDGSMTPKRFAEQVTKHYRHCDPWGFKFLVMPSTPRDALDYLYPRLVIVCTRPRALVVDSMRRYCWRDKSRDWERVYDSRIVARDRLLSGHKTLHVDFTHNQSSTEVRALIAPEIL